jgi:hypothetical protein
MESRRTYFFTATIHKWILSLEGDSFKEIIISSLNFLHKKGLIRTCNFALLPISICNWFAIRRYRNYQISSPLGLAGFNETLSFYHGFHPWLIMVWLRCSPIISRTTFNNTNGIQLWVPLRRIVATQAIDGIVRMNTYPHWSIYPMKRGLYKRNQESKAVSEDTHHSIATLTAAKAGYRPLPL